MWSISKFIENRKEQLRISMCENVDYVIGFSRSNFYQNGELIFKKVNNIYEIYINSKQVFYYNFQEPSKTILPEYSAKVIILSEIRELKRNHPNFNPDNSITI